MALVELIMPKMGESIMEATILHWLKKPGDTIEQTRHGAETVVGADRRIGKILDLLQDGIGPAAGEDVAR